MAGREAHTYTRGRGWLSMATAATVGWLFVAILSTQAYAGLFDHYAVRDSGVIGRSLREDDLYWLDNQRLIFIGWRPGVELKRQARPEVRMIDTCLQL